MTKERDKKLSRDQQLLEAARLGQFNQLETKLRQIQQLKTKKKSNPLASLRKCTGLNSIRDPVTGFTCLHHAALNGHSQCVQLALEHGAGLNAVDYKGSSALHLAAWAGRLQVIKVLLDYAAPHTTGGHRSVSSSISRLDDQFQAHKSTAKQRPQADDDERHEEIDLDLRNNDGQTALLLAAQFGHSDVVAELISRSANVQLRNKHLETALDLACLNGHLATARLLLNCSPQLVADLRRSHSTASVALNSARLRELDAAHSDAAPSSSQRQSRSPWSSILRASGSEPTKGHERRPSLASIRSEDDKSGARLIGHSPLHYAARRCHVNVASLLLDHYEANLFQMTSLGSVLHEIALNNCDSMTPMSVASGGSNATNYTNGDMLRLFLAHLSRTSAGNIEETRARWNGLLGLRNSQQMSVFDVINELNNQPAQDIKRTIFELSEQIEHGLKLAQQQQQQQQLNTAQNCNVNYNLPKQVHQSQLFGNAQQINSFLTMNRARHRQHQSQCVDVETRQASFANKENANHDHAVCGTQTIDRRATRNKHQMPDPNSFQNQLTRSVSNLDDANSKTGGRSGGNPTPAQLYGSVDVNWNSLASQEHLASFQRRLMSEQQQTVGSNEIGDQNRKKRSKSRDLGSILAEVGQNQQMSTLNASRQADHQARPMSAQAQVSNQLVRSQTDCSHLLGRLFGGHQETAVGDLRLTSRDNFHATNLAHHQQSLLQHQPRSSENSSSMLGECHLQENRRLVPTAIAQQHSATLDRRAINRHYHVYDHEFYPPRLVSDQVLPAQPSKYHSFAPAKLSAERQKQAAVAVVPPLVRADIGGQAAHAAGSNRLSLNLEPRIDQRDSNANYHSAESRHEQIHRFMKSEPRKSMPQPAGNFEQRFLLENSLERQKQLQSLHSSQSFDSHFGSSETQQQKCLFESTRQALIHDFDKMIGRELLQPNSNSSTSSSRGHITPSSSQNSSLLTGISLDMDCHGEHLTVSGTRVTMPPMLPAQNLLGPQPFRQPQFDSGNVLNSSHRPGTFQADCNQLKVASNQSLASHSSSSSSSMSAGAANRKPPQKPPRPSLKSQQIYRSMQAAHSTSLESHPKRSSTIYDQPSLGLAGPGSSAGSQMSLQTPSPSARAVPPARPTPKIGPAQSSITEPPNERPPPPPTQQAPGSPMPLNVITSELKRTNFAGAHALKSSVSSSNSPSSSSSASSSFRQDRSNRATDLNRFAPSSAGGRHQMADGDSGFCTSNSPASHDSENGMSELCAGLHVSVGLTPNLDGQVGLAVVMSPPSPRTAQMSIEEALVPLEKPSSSQEVANQTEMQTTDRLSDPPEPGRAVCEDDSLDSQVEMVFGWLGLAKRCDRDAKLSKVECDGRADYENCINLQRSLKTDPKCESGSNMNSSSQRPSSALDRLVAHYSADDDLNLCPKPIMRVESDVCEAKIDQTSADISDESSSLCKEIMLKVVVDKSSKLRDGDEVFYIDPTELQKISSSEECSKSEAQTLTDEELCASVDKDSGYIRFTLKKRRGLPSSEDQKLSDALKGLPREVSAKATLQDDPDLKQTKVGGEPSNDSSETAPQALHHDRPSPTIKQRSMDGTVDLEGSARRKPSADSLQMDVSQRSSSSNSSEMSIKSIVSFKEKASLISSNGNGTVLADLNSKAETKSTSEGLSSPEKEHAPLEKSSEPVKPEIKRRSLVSEAARKVEAAAAAAAGGPVKQPVAAARMTLAKRDANAADTNKDGNIKPPVSAKKSICWPPSKSSAPDAVDNKSVASETVPVVGRVTANRLSFQKLIEENNKANSFVPLPNRPKPAPPAKPAGLVAAQRLSKQIN